MTMTPEERRMRMHKALGHNTSGAQNGRSARSASRRPASAQSGSTGNRGNGGQERIPEERSASAGFDEMRWNAGDAEDMSASRRRSQYGSLADDERQTGRSRGNGSNAADGETRSGRSRASTSGRGSNGASAEEIAGRSRGNESSAADGETRSGRGRGTNGAGIGIEPARIALLAAAVIVLFLLIFGLVKVMGGSGKPGETGPGETSQAAAESASEENETEPAETEPARDYLNDARLMAAQYDYDGAIELLKSMPDYEASTEAQELVKTCEETKETLVEQDLQEITHVFFHILCVDPVNSFDASKWGNQAGGYNSLMTTIDEFKKMMQEMYDKGFVLVSMHDMAEFTENADGKVTVTKGKIMLPPGKKAFVMSEDDVCYYEYMVGAGYADKMIVGEDGKPTLHYTDKDGNEFVGDYDLVGVLDTFIDEHPDFSYKGHKACLVFTGYNGILGYRTDETYDPNSELYDPKLEQGHDVEAERKEAIEVLKALVADGYDVGSHSWGHRDLGQIEYDRFKRDCDRWERNVAPLIREATGKQPDIIIYPKGADVADWHGYSHSNQRFDYMHKLGFRIFCNVDSSKYWVQFGDDYMRQGRRALDGYNMWNDIANGYHRLEDLFDNVSDIFDPARPTPVPAY